MSRRRSLEESLASFTGEPGTWAPPRDANGDIFLLDHHAGIDRAEEDVDPTDITFFRSGYTEADFSNLTIPRRYMCRSSFEKVSFANTDLNQSFMCWNDFIACDFTDADLTCCDMRSSLFKDCRFIRCKLIGAKLQRSNFEGCDFTDADVTGAWIDDCTDDWIELSEEQMNRIGHFEEVGPQPKGG